MKKVKTFENFKLNENKDTDLYDMINYKTSIILDTSYFIGELLDWIKDYSEENEIKITKEDIKKLVSEVNNLVDPTTDLYYRDKDVWENKVDDDFLTTFFNKKFIYNFFIDNGIISDLEYEEGKKFNKMINDYDISVNQYNISKIVKYLKSLTEEDIKNIKRKQDSDKFNI